MPDGRRTTRVPAGWFDERYAGGADPWGFESSAYEARKFDLTVACLPEARYGAAVEPGCAFGTLSRRLAARCDRLLAFDASEVVVRRAAAALADLPQVEVRHLEVPEVWPAGPWDLVVLSEVAYYLPGPELDDLVARVVASMAVGADLVAVHWTGPTSYPTPGPEVARHIDRSGALERLVEHRERPFELGVWRRR